jgi:hypothetical protein
LAIFQKGESLGGKRVMGPDKIMEGVAVGQILDPEGRLIGLLQAISWSERSEAMPAISPRLGSIGKPKWRRTSTGSRSPDLDYR